MGGLWSYFISFSFSRIYSTYIIHTKSCLNLAWNFNLSSYTWSVKDSFSYNVTLCNQIKFHNWEGQVMRSRCWFCFCHHTVDWFFITPCWLIEFDIVENKRRRAGDIRAVYRVIINYSVFVSSARQSWQDRSSSPSFSRIDSCCDSSACGLVYLGHCCVTRLPVWQ